MTIGRTQKPILAIMTSLVMILGGLVIAFPFQEVEADHLQCTVRLEITRGSTSLFSGGLGLPNCDDDTVFTFNLGKRFAKLFERCVGTNPFDTTLDTDTTTFDNFDCKGPFNIEIEKFANSPGQHGGAIFSITVRVI